MLYFSYKIYEINFIYEIYGIGELADGKKMQDEIDIVWLEDPLRFRYLRETVWTSMAPRRKPAKARFADHAVTVGYSVVKPDKYRERHAFSRRIWWLKTYDRDLKPDGPYSVMGFILGPAPVEAVVPDSIRVGERSLRYGDSEMWKEDVKARFPDLKAEK